MNGRDPRRRRRLLEYAAVLPTFGVPVVSTRDFAMRLDMSTSHASHTLDRLAEHGVIRKLAPGTWSTAAVVDPFAVASHILAPHTSYVSMRSAMNIHGMISQVPGRIEVVSTGNGGRHTTSVGTIDVHVMQGRLVTGFEVKGWRKVAIPEKAVFDFLYLKRSADLLPEVESPTERTFSEPTLRSYIDLVDDPSRRTWLGQQVNEFMASLDRG